MCSIRLPFRRSAIAGVALGLAASCASTPPDHHGVPPGERQLAYHASEIPYGPGPSSAPFPCEMAVLEGSPREAGLFTIRLRMSEPWTMPPHTHPRAERVTVLAGTIHVGFADVVDRAASREFGVGDYYVNAPCTAHFVWADEPVEIQITGMGPWEIHLLD